MEMRYLSVIFTKKTLGQYYLSLVNTFLGQNHGSVTRCEDITVSILMVRNHPTAIPKINKLVSRHYYYYYYYNNNKNKNNIIYDLYYYKVV